MMTGIKDILKVFIYLCILTIFFFYLVSIFAPTTIIIPAGGECGFNI